MITSSSSSLAFHGFANPNYTQVPDELFDQLITQISDAELRVLLYIIRRTFGFKREADTISLSQMTSGITTREGQVLDSGTGLSKATVACGLKGLREQGIILAERNRSVARGDEPTTYRLRFAADNPNATEIQRPLSRRQDTPSVSRLRQAVSHQQDTQETGEQETVVESSKGEDLVENTGIMTGAKPVVTASHRGQTTSLAEGSLATILSHRVRRDVGRDDRLAIGAAIERFATDLGDQAELKVSVSRALNLYQASGVGRDAYIDLLFRAKGDVQDRRNYPGKAPIPRNRMAYFFAIVEDHLGVRSAEPTSGAEGS